MKYTELRQFLREANRQKLSPVEKDLFQYYASRVGKSASWRCPDSEVAKEIGRSRNAICDGRNSLKSRGWIKEISPFVIKIVQRFSVVNETQSVGTATGPSLNGDSTVGNATEPVGNATDESQIRLLNKDKEKLRRESKRNKEETRESISDNEPSEWEWPISELLNTFPNMTLTPTAVGYILADVKEGDEIPWANTLTKYLRNHDPTTKSYMPEKTGNLLDVFRDEKARLEKGNGSNKFDSNKTPVSTAPAKKFGYGEHVT